VREGWCCRFYMVIRPSRIIMMVEHSWILLALSTVVVVDVCCSWNEVLKQINTNLPVRPRRPWHGVFTTRCATSRKAFVSGEQRRWLVGKRQRRFGCDATPNNNKHRTTASSNWWHGAASLVSTSARCCNASDKKQKENSHHLFYSCSIDFFC